MAVKSRTEERVEEHSRRIKMLEEVFVPMAKAAMEILSGKPGEPGMAENVRNMSAQLTNLTNAYQRDASDTKNIRKDAFERIGKLEGWREKTEGNHQNEKEIKLMGIKTTAETKIAIINGLFVLISGVVAYLFSR